MEFYVIRLKNEGGKFDHSTALTLIEYEEKKKKKKKLLYYIIIKQAFCTVVLLVFRLVFI